MAKKTNTKIALSILLAFGLSACGGGGGAGPTSGGNTTPQSCSNGSNNYPTCDNYQVNVAPPTYTADTNELVAFTELNVIRQKMSLGLLAQNVAMDTAALAHANYIVANNLCAQAPSVDPATGWLWLHAEAVGNTGFTGTIPLSRANAAGYGGSFGSEVADCGMASGRHALGWFVNSVYHRAALLDPSLRDVGFAVMPGKANVIDSGYKSVAGIPGPAYAGAYPYDGQVGSATAFDHSVESPRPLPDIDPATQRYVGNPVSMHVATGNILTVTTFELLDAAGNKIAARLLTSSNDPAKNLVGNVAFLIPLQPLAAGATYKANFAGTNNGAALSKTWSFKTAAGVVLSAVGNQTMKGTDTLRINVTTPSGYYGLKDFSVDRTPGDPSPAPNIKSDQDGITLTGAGNPSNPLVIHFTFYDRAEPTVTQSITVTVLQ